MDSTSIEINSKLIRRYIPDDLKESLPEEVVDLLFMESVRQTLEIGPENSSLDGVRLTLRKKEDRELSPEEERGLAARELEENHDAIIGKVKELAETHHLSESGQKENRAEHYGGSNTQFIWNELIHEATSDVQHEIENGLSLELLLNMIAKRRSFIAHYLGHSGEDEMTLRRDEEYAKRNRRSERGVSETRIQDRYYDYLTRPEVLKRLNLKLNALNDEQKKAWGVDLDTMICPTMAKTDTLERDLHEIEITGFIDKKTVVLTKIQLMPSYSIFIGTSNGTLCHTHPKLIPEILEYSGSLFNEWRDGDHSEKENLKAIAKIHWWVSNAMIYHRGSAAGAEILVSAMMARSGIQFSGFKDEYQVDLEAMTTPNVEEYIALFPKYLKH